MVVAGLDSWNARVTESKRLMEWGFGAWQAKPLFQAGAKVGSARVQLGSESEVSLVAPRNLAVTIPAGLVSGGATNMKIRYQGPVAAPIKKGDHIADLVVTTGETPPQVVPLVAGEDVGSAGFFGRIWLGLKSLFGMA
jgi:D-alanyl-D-alanine carboxypeptidase (penicillin-binding protein 5/6)